MEVNTILRNAGGMVEIAMNSIPNILIAVHKIQLSSVTENVMAVFTTRLSVALMVVIVTYLTQTILIVSG